MRILGQLVAFQPQEGIAIRAAGLLPGVKRKQLIEFRTQKDQFFRQDPDSPIPEHLRASFSGLEYYPPDPTLDLELDIEPADGSRVLLETSDGAQRQYRKAVKVHFEVEGEMVELTLLAADHGHDHSLFLPFRDATSGNETYGAGRYLDVDAPTERKVRIDFNLAYSPSCAYDDRYSCPLPPIENWLRVPIRAGEKS